MQPRILAAILAAIVATHAGLAGAPQDRGTRVTQIRNPIVPGFHPDPSIVRVGEDYYLVNSSFEFFPGVPIHHSRDLVHWRTIGHVLTRDSQLPLAGAGPSGGIFAPTIRHHAGTFYMITTNVSGPGNFYVSAKDPAGPWSEPIRVEGQGGIDPSLFFDDDGTVYLSSTGGAPGSNEGPGIYQSTIDLATGKVTSTPRLVWRGTGGRYPEGPHLYKIGGFYYLKISEGGTEYGHMVTIARSRSPWGPFEPCPRNPILTHRNTQMDQPIQGTGHSDLVQDPEGRWWMVLLAFRPQGGYFHHLGRETFLAPVTWDAAGWPVVNAGRPLALAMPVQGLTAHPWPTPPVRTEFAGALGHEWNHLRNPDRSAYALDLRPGWLALHGRKTTLDEAGSPTFVGRRQQHLHARAAARLDTAPQGLDEAGLTVYHNPSHHYELGIRRHASSGREVFLRQRIGAALVAVTGSSPVPDAGPIVLEIVATPLQYEFAWIDAAGTRHPLGHAATRYVSTEVAGGFTGVYFGLYATSPGEPAAAPAFVDWFEYEPREPPR